MLGQSTLGDNEDDELLDPERQAQPRIARPNATGTAPGASLRGLNVPPSASSASASPSSASPAPGSTEDLENLGTASHLAPRPVAKPSGLDSRLSTDRGELVREQRTGSGISQIEHGSPEGGIGIAKPHPVIGGILRGLSTVGSVISPSIMSRIPGTEEHHNHLLDEQTGRIGEDLGEQKEQAALGKTQADTEEAQARADAINHPPGQIKEEQILYDKASNPIGYRDEQGAYHGAEDPSLPQGVKDVLAAAKPKTPPGASPLADRVPQLNQMLAARYQVLSPGQTLPSQYTLPANATKEDYDRVDKGLEAEERARGTKAQQDQANEMRRQTLALTQEHQAENRADKNQAALDKKIAPYQQTLDAVQEAREYAKEKTGPGDYSLLLAVVDATKPKAGFRFTKSEQDLLIGARSIANSAEALYGKAAGGVLLTDQQRQQMLDVLAIVEKHSQKKMDEAQGGNGNHSTVKDYGAAPAGKQDGATGTLADGTKVVVKAGRLVAQ